IIPSMNRFRAAFRRYCWKILAAPAVVVGFDLLKFAVRWLTEQILGNAAWEEAQSWAQGYNVLAIFTTLATLAETNPVAASVVVAALVVVYAAIRSEYEVRMRPERFTEPPKPELPTEVPPKEKEELAVFRNLIPILERAYVAREEP